MNVTCGSGFENFFMIYWEVYNKIVLSRGGFTKIFDLRSLADVPKQSIQILLIINHFHDRMNSKLAFRSSLEN